MILLSDSEVEMISGGNFVAGTIGSMAIQAGIELVGKVTMDVLNGLAFPGTVNGINAISYDAMGNAVQQTTEDGDGE